VHDLAELAGDLDHAMLAGRVRMPRVERERLQDDATDRPGPRFCSGRENEHDDEQQD
jgi:hypothetical protein